MKSLTTNRRILVGLVQSARAAIVVPSLFAVALLVIKQPEMAGFAVLGTFAHLVLVNYDAAGPGRFIQSATLTFLGSIMVAVGALVSSHAWLAVSGAVAVGFLTEAPLLLFGSIANIRGALLMSFMSAVVAPAPGGSVFLYVSGWVVAGAVAQPALLLIWTSLEDRPVDQGEGSNGVGALAPAAGSNRLERAFHSGFALGLAVLVTRLLDLEHAFWVVLGVVPLLNTSRGSAARIFWQEQAGTLIGFLSSALLVAILGSLQALYWLILPLVVFGSAYAARAIGLMAGQAAFTVFAVMLFCILLPQQRHAGFLRLEDIAIGGAVSLIVGFAQRHLEGNVIDRLRSLGGACERLRSKASIRAFVVLKTRIEPSFAPERGRALRVLLTGRSLLCSGAFLPYRGRTGTRAPGSLPALRLPIQAVAERQIRPASSCSPQAEQDARRGRYSPPHGRHGPQTVEDVSTWIRHWPP